MKYILFILTMIACVYAIYCDYAKNVYKQAFVVLVYDKYHPTTEEEYNKIAGEIVNEFNILKRTNRSRKDK